MFYDSKHVDPPIPPAGAAPQTAPRTGASRCARLRLFVAAPPLLPRPARRWLLRGSLWLALACMPGVGVAVGGADASLERRVKAGFLYKFLGYTEFPGSVFAHAAAPFVIGVVAADEIAGELMRIVAGRRLQGRPIAIRVFRDSETPSGVHLLFVGGSDSARLRSLLTPARPAPVLLVSESEHGLQHGSVINFRVVEEQVRFDVSLEAASKNSVKLSSRLLTVANHVYKGAP